MSSQKGSGADGISGGDGRFDDNVNISSITSEINAQMSDLRASRQLAGEIPERGAALYDLLNKEVFLREERSTALGRPLELKDVEKSLKASIRAVEEETKQTMLNLNNIATDEASLDAKIQKKQSELDRQQKRLAQLQSVRPAYMDEYEKLEGSLKTLYAEYVDKFRNLAYLNQIQNEYDKAEHERKMEAEISLRKMAEKMREEERARAAEAGRISDPSADSPQPTGPTARVYGNITGAGLSDDEEEDDDDEEDDEEDDHSMMSEEDDDLVQGGAGHLGHGGMGGEKRTAVMNEGLSDYSEEDGAYGTVHPSGGHNLASNPGGLSQPPPPNVDNSDDDF